MCIGSEKRKKWMELRREGVGEGGEREGVGAFRAKRRGAGARRVKTKEGRGVRSYNCTGTGGKGGTAATAETAAGRKEKNQESQGMATLRKRGGPAQVTRGAVNLSSNSNNIGGQQRRGVRPSVRPCRIVSRLPGPQKNHSEEENRHSRQT